MIYLSTKTVVVQDDKFEPDLLRIETAMSDDGIRIPRDELPDLVCALVRAIAERQATDTLTISAGS